MRTRVRGNTIGQANAVSDKTLDLRKCKYDNVSVKGITLSGALMVDSVFDNSDFSETGYEQSVREDVEL